MDLDIEGTGLESAEVTSKVAPRKKCLETVEKRVVGESFGAKLIVEMMNSVGIGIIAGWLIPAVNGMDFGNLSLSL